MAALTRLLLGSAAATVDRAVLAALQMRNRRIRARAEGLSHRERMEALAAIRSAYCRAEFLANPDAYFSKPGPVIPRESAVRDLPWGGRCVDLTWESTSEPFHDSVRAAYTEHSANRIARARLYGEGGGRPAVILLHGYMGGQWAVEERVWPIRWMNRHALDVAVAQLPFHGLRTPTGGGAPPFPGADPRFTNEGFRQAVADLRVLKALLAERGARDVGVMGMSLGGYTTALLATVERGLAFAVPIIPLSSIADFARDQGRLGAGERASLQHAALEAANQVVSPLARAPLIARERVLVVGAQADRVTPIAHAARLARHFDARLLRLDGGHLVQTWRAPAFRAIKAMLKTNGVL
jgi:pimeloyl-ACP methyl ester carboxylesterase